MHSMHTALAMLGSMLCFCAESACRLCPQAGDCPPILSPSLPAYAHSALEVCRSTEGRHSLDQKQHQRGGRLMLHIRA